MLNIHPYYNYNNDIQEIRRELEINGREASDLNA